MNLPPGIRSALSPLVKIFFRLRYQFLHQHKMQKPVMEQIAGLSIIVLPGVLNPHIFLSGERFVKTLNTGLIPVGSDVLELGTGSGAAAVYAAKLGASVTATDINQEAVRCVELNRDLHNLHDNLTVIKGDLFEPVAGRKYDVILFNPPYFSGTPRTAFDHALYYGNLPGLFTTQLHEHLKSDGYAILILSSVGNCNVYLDAFKKNNLDVSVIKEWDLICEKLTVYRVQPGKEK